MLLGNFSMKLSLFSATVTKAKQKLLSSNSSKLPPVASVAPMKRRKTLLTVDTPGKEGEKKRNPTSCAVFHISFLDSLIKLPR